MDESLVIGWLVGTVEDDATDDGVADGWVDGGWLDGEVDDGAVGVWTVVSGLLLDVSLV